VKTGGNISKERTRIQSVNLSALRLFISWSLSIICETSVSTNTEWIIRNPWNTNLCF